MQRIRKSKDMQVQLAMDELDRYRARVARIMRLKERKTELEINYTAVRGIDYSKVCVQGGMPKDYLVETAIKWADIDKELDELILQNQRELNLIEYKLSLLKTIEQTVLFKYFIEGRSVMEIATLLQYSEQGVRKIKTNALKKYAELFIEHKEN
nr:MAG TPA: Protein of unknown function (DUF722) [Caudoviricetes sp.]